MASRIASTKTYQDAGIQEFTWVTAGGNTCQDCASRHGDKGSDEYFRMIGKPATGWSVCQEHCQCILEPVGFKGVPKPQPYNPLAFNSAGKHKSVKDSIAWMKTHIADSVTLGKLKDVGVANEMTTAFHSVFKKYKIKKLRQIKTIRSDSSDWANANGMRLNIRGDQFDRNVLNNQYKNTVTNFRSKYLKELAGIRERLKGVEVGGFGYNSLKRLELYNLRRLKEIDDGGFTRWGVSYKGRELGSTIVHELGHVIHDQYTAGINTKALRTAQDILSAKAWNRKMQELYRTLKNNNDLGWLSEYGSGDHWEFFAETFAMYMNPAQKKNIPKNVLDFFDDYLTINGELMSGS